LWGVITALLKFIGWLKMVGGNGFEPLTYWVMTGFSTYKFAFKFNMLLGCFLEL
jgi:hypothetical protein